MNGKLIGGFIALSGLIAGVAIYYLQVYGFYDEVAPEDLEISLTLAATGALEALEASEVQAIDGDSSPLKFRACFKTSVENAVLRDTYVAAEKPVPLTAPGWFDCFDAEAIGAALEAGQAQAYLGQAEVRDGVDRVVAIMEDGRGFAWHQLNEKYSE